MLLLSSAEMALLSSEALAQVGYRRILLRHHERESNTYNKRGSDRCYDISLCRHTLVSITRSLSS